MAMFLLLKMMTMIAMLMMKQVSQVGRWKKKTDLGYVWLQKSMIFIIRSWFHITVWWSDFPQDDPVLYKKNFSPVRRLNTYIMVMVIIWPRPQQYVLIIIIIIYQEKDKHGQKMHLSSIITRWVGLPPIQTHGSSHYLLASGMIQSSRNYQNLLSH